MVIAIELWICLCIYSLAPLIKGRLNQSMLTLARTDASWYLYDSYYV
jgi:hypothetical protein